MSDYIKHKKYKLPNGRTVTADFDEFGITAVTIQAMDALFDIINSSDVVEVVRCKDCIYWFGSSCKWREDETPDPDDYCSIGEKYEQIH